MADLLARWLSDRPVRRLCVSRQRGITWPSRNTATYDAVGLADLVRKKQVSAGELLDEAIARTAKVDPANQRGGRQTLRLCRAADRQGTSRRPLHRRAVSAEGSRSPRGHADHVGRAASTRTMSPIIPAPSPSAFSATGVTIFGKSSSPEFGLMPTTEPRCSVRPAIPGISRTPPAVRPAAPPRRSRRASSPSRMPATAAARSAFRPPPPACSD